MKKSSPFVQGTLILTAANIFPDLLDSIIEYFWLD